MFQQIMVPLDGSELAERALPCAARLGVATGATLHLVQVVELMPPPTGPFALAYAPGGIHGDLVAQETQQATAYLDKMRERPFGDPVSLAHAVVPLDGSAPAETALRVVKGLAPDVVRDVPLPRPIEG